MNNIVQYVAQYEGLLVQSPSFLCIHDLAHKIVFANDNATKVMGYKSRMEVTLTSYSDMKCKASVDAEQFEAQDKLVFSSLNKVTFLSYHQYADKTRLILGEKSPLFNKEGELLGLISYWQDISQYNLIDISRFLFAPNRMESDQYPRKFTYILKEEEINKNYHLSPRQLECVFFLLRGKTAKEIAKFLNLSCRTVEEYLNDIKIKMECSRKNQLIDKLLDEGFFNIFPKNLMKRTVT